MSVTKGIPVGGTGSFKKVNSPVGSTDPAGGPPTWATDNPLAVVTASADGVTADVAVDKTATVGSTFSLTATAKRADGTACVGVALVPILPLVPTVEAVAFEIMQTA